MIPLEVRAATAQDLAAIWELMHGLAEYERMTEIITGTRAQLGEALFGERAFVEAIVAESGGRLIGYALFYPTFSSFRARSRLWLEDLFVEPDARGIGAGRALLASLARLALARGHERIDWHVLDWNAPAIAFYEHLGATHQVADWLTYGLQEQELRRLAGDTH